MVGDYLRGERRMVAESIGWPSTCTKCPSSPRGWVDRQGDVPGHYCKQCAEHCQMSAYTRRTAS